MDPQDPQQQPTQPPAPAPMQHNTLMGVLSYISVLVIIPFLTAKEDPFVAFHIRQGLVLLIIEIGVWVVMHFVWFLWPLWQVVNLGTLVLAIIGIINVVHGKQKELPLVGHLAASIKI